MPSGKKPRPFFVPLSEEEAQTLYRQHYKTAIAQHASMKEIIPLTASEHETDKDPGFYTISCVTCGRRMFIEATPSTAYGYVHGNLQSHIPCTREKEHTRPAVHIVDGGA